MAGTAFSSVDDSTLENVYESLNMHMLDSDSGCVSALSEFVAPGSSAFEQQEPAYGMVGSSEGTSDLMKEFEDAVVRLQEVFDAEYGFSHTSNQPMNDDVVGSPSAYDSAAYVSPDSYHNGDGSWSSSPRSVFDDDVLEQSSYQTLPSSPAFGEVPRTPVKRGKWTSEEDDRLRFAVVEFPSNWKRIARYVGDRTPQQCLHRWRKSVQPGINRKRWSAAGDELLCRAVARIGKNWTKVQALVPGRTDVQCRERFVNILDPEICKEAWSADEDAALLRAVREVGAGRWSQIATAMPRRRTDYACRKRYEKLTRAAAGTC